MNASPREAIDYGRFAERLAAHRAEQDPAKRWGLFSEFHQEWGYEVLERLTAELGGEWEIAAPLIIPGEESS
jgi:hypothetical protein